jgi:hypothetical protein
MLLIIANCAYFHKKMGFLWVLLLIPFTKGAKVLSLKRETRPRKVKAWTTTRKTI